MHHGQSEQRQQKKTERLPAFASSRRGSNSSVLNFSCSIIFSGSIALPGTNPTLMHRMPIFFRNILICVGERLIPVNLVCRLLLEKMLRGAFCLKYFSRVS